MRQLTDFIRSSYARLQAYLGQQAPPAPSASLPADSPNDDQTQFAQALALHQQGNLNDAEILYRALLLKYPGHFELLHRLGMVQGQRGNFAAAVAFIEQAIVIDPDNTAVHGSLGNCLKGLGKHEAALACYDRALALQPNDADTWSNRGATLRDLKRPEQALESYDRALAINPHHVLALDNRGTTLRELKRPEEALASHDKALAINPSYALAHYNRGLILAELKQLEAACVSFKHALALNPDNIDVLTSLGSILHNFKHYEDALVIYEQVLTLKPGSIEVLVDRGATLRALNRHEEALASFDKALSLEPDHVAAHFNRGISLGDVKQVEEALVSYERALALKPNYVEAHNNRGTMLRDLRRETEALSSYGKALAINPDHASALFNRGNLLMDFKKNHEAIADFSRLVALKPDYNFALSHLLHAKMSCCNWRDTDTLEAVILREAQQEKKSLEPFYCLGLSTSPKFLKRCAEIYAAEKFLTSKIRPVLSTPRQNDKIRLGYVAGEFRHHATSILMAGLFERHDSSRFELYAFDNGWDDGSNIRKRLENAFTGIVDISRSSDIEATAKIRNNRIDILVDLNGHVGLGRTGVFSHRPAPIQVNWLGFPGTMGVPYMDYIIGDPNVIPAGHEIYYSEKVVRLPQTYQVNDSKRVIAARIPTRIELKLPDPGFVFCCFNNNYKITPDVFGIWMRLLNQVERSVLWLLEDNATASRNLRSEATVRGVAPDRLVFAPRLDLPDHLARHQLADLFLDTLPCNAHTTASDALWAGLPLLTCMGNTFAGRVAGSLLHAIGLPELITENLADYEALALKLATTPALLTDLRTRLARNRTTHALFDIDRFRKHIESAYLTMFERWSRGEAPESFNVSNVE